MKNKEFKFDTRGLEKFSLVEWPGKITAIIFTGGCNFHCPFCHNPELVTELDKTPEYPWEEIEKFLDKKVGWVDAIMVTGGEPTIQADLPKVLKLIKDKGFAVGIATNGSNPEMIKKLIEKNLVDRICMDIKSNWDKYPEACGKKVDLDKTKESVALLINSPIEYEFKLTLVPDLVAKEDIGKIGEQIKGAKKITLQQFRPLKTLDKSYLNKVPYGKDEIEAIAKELEEYVEEVNLDFID